MCSRREIDKTLTVEGQEDFTASHIFGTAIFLEPVPFFTEDLGDLSPAFIPMLTDSSPNELEVVLGDGSFSDGDG